MLQIKQVDAALVKAFIKAGNNSREDPDQFLNSSFAMEGISLDYFYYLAGWTHRTENTLIWCPVMVAIDP